MAATDLFGRRKMEFGAAFATDSAKLGFSFSSTDGNEVGNVGPLGQSAVGLLVQQMTTQYTQELRRAYELGSQKTYYIVGRPRGQFSMQRLLGPTSLITAFYYKFGNACCAANNVLRLRVDTSCTPGDGDAAGLQGEFVFDGVVLTSVQMSMQAENMVVSENLSGEFVSCEIPFGLPYTC